MLKLLIALSKFLNKKLNIESESKVEKSIGLNHQGAFIGVKDNELQFYIDEIYDEEEDVKLRIQYICACGEPVFRLLSDDYGFGCEHCDSVCELEECNSCYSLFNVDFGGENAEI